MKDEHGEPTRLALSAVPQTMADAKKLAAEGHELLEQYHAAKDERAARTSVKAVTKTTAKTAKKVLRKLTDQDYGRSIEKSAK